MKTNDDVVRGWVKKARGDMLSMKLSLRGGALDGACFHAQQVAEKLLKAYMISKDRDYPFTHDLEKLMDVASRVDPRFLKFLPTAVALNPYAVDIRYNIYATPTVAKARSAARKAETIARFILDLLGPLGAQPRQRKTPKRK